MLASLLKILSSLFCSLFSLCTLENKLYAIGFFRQVSDYQPLKDMIYKTKIEVPFY